MDPFYYPLKWVACGLAFRWAAPPLLLRFFSLILPYLTTVIAIILVASKLTEDKKKAKQAADGPLSPSAAAHIELRSHPLNTPIPHTKTASPSGSPPPPTASISPFNTPPKLPSSSNAGIEGDAGHAHSARASASGRSSPTSPSGKRGLRASLRASIQSNKRTEVQGVLEGMLTHRIALMGSSFDSEIEKFGLEEMDYRGERYENHDQPLYGNHDVLVLTVPDVLEQVFTAYLEAGVDILATNTFKSTWLSQAEWGLQDDEEVALMNVESARQAKRCTAAFMEQNPGQLKLVAGALGASASVSSPSAGFSSAEMSEMMVDAFFKQISSLYAGGVDLFLVKIDSGSLEAAAVLCALDQFLSKMKDPLPVIICGTYSQMSRSLTEVPIHKEFWRAVSHIKPIAVGLQCSTDGSQDLLKYNLTSLAQCCPDCYICCGPSEDSLSTSIEDEDSLGTRVAEELQSVCEESCVNLIDCCNVPPHLVGDILEMTSMCLPRKVPEVPMMWAPPPLTMAPTNGHKRSQHIQGSAVSRSIELLRQKGMAV